MTPRSSPLDDALDILRVRQYFNAITMAREAVDGIRKDASFLSAARRAVLPLPFDRHTPPDGQPFPTFRTMSLEHFQHKRVGLLATGGSGTRMHHKFLVIDFDKSSARVYLGSYNFSTPADLKNGENLLILRDRRIAVSYLVEALSMLDHYHFRVAQLDAKKKRKKLELALPPRKPGQKAWWDGYFTVARKIYDRTLFS